MLIFGKQWKLRWSATHYRISMPALLAKIKKKYNFQGLNYISIWNFSLCSLDMRIETA